MINKEGEGEAERERERRGGRRKRRRKGTYVAFEELEFLEKDFECVFDYNFELYFSFCYQTHLLLYFGAYPDDKNQ